MNYSCFLWAPRSRRPSTDPIINPNKMLLEKLDMVELFCDTNFCCNVNQLRRNKNNVGFLKGCCRTNFYLYLKN